MAQPRRCLGRGNHYRKLVGRNGSRFGCPVRGRGERKAQKKTPIMR